MTLTLTSSAFDPDGPIPRSFAHSRIAPSHSGLAEGESPAEAESGTIGFGRLGYLGPAPPAGDPPHHYVFRLLAVDAPIEVKGHPSYGEVEAATDGHVLATATLVGTYRS